MLHSKYLMETAYFDNTHITKFHVSFKYKVPNVSPNKNSFNKYN